MDRAETQNFLFDQGVAELMEGLERPTYEWKVESRGFENGLWTFGVSVRSRKWQKCQKCRESGLGQRSRALETTIDIDFSRRIQLDRFRDRFSRFWVSSGRDFRPSGHQALQWGPVAEA